MLVFFQSGNKAEKFLSLTTGLPTVMRRRETDETNAEIRVNITAICRFAVLVSLQRPHLSKMLSVSPCVCRCVCDQLALWESANQRSSPHTHTLAQTLPPPPEVAVP